MINYLLKRTQLSMLETISFNASDKKSSQQLSYFKNRKQQLKNHKYPSFKPSISLKSFRQKYSYLITATTNNQALIQQQMIAGRVSSIRKHGKTTFIDIRQEHERVQLAMQGNFNMNRGDIIGIKGEPFVTKKGELSLNVKDIELLSPCLWMLPEYEYLDDQQTRFRNRHIDLITNSSSFEKLKVRAKIITYLRNYLNNLGYMQVETPVLSRECGGAIAKPFKTFHNDHKIQMFMRIAPQLYLKKLLIGGMEKVFQIGKNFRNESIDQTHNPEFTSCELYCSYSNYLQMKQFTQKLITSIVYQVNGSYQIQKPGSNRIIDLTPPWKVVEFIPELQKQLNRKFPTQFSSPQSYNFINKLCQDLDVACDQPRTISRLLDKLGGKYLQNLGDPLFIMNHPRIMSPLAKPITETPHLTQRFQLFINGWEIVNSYTELNQPEIQRENSPQDGDYIEALQYGLMPCAGWGIGIDRLVMLLTKSQRIQQIIAFPLLRDKFKEVL